MSAHPQPVPRKADMDELTARLRALYSAVVSDVLDDVGVRDRAMQAALTPLGSVRRMAGRAATLEVVAVDRIPQEPYKVQFAAIDALRTGEILVVAAPPVASAFWGELITTRALARGCDGVVVIPTELAEDVISRAERKAATEDQVRSRLAAGESIADTYARYKVMGCTTRATATSAAGSRQRPRRAARTAPDRCRSGTTPTGCDGTTGRAP